MKSAKNFKLNCDVCDARRITEESYREYERLTINADILLTDKRSKPILDSLPIKLNVDTVLDVEGETKLITQNGYYEIKPGEVSDTQLILVVNGRLHIAPKTEEVLKSYAAIVVNGCLEYPQGASVYLSRITVNGQSECYPEDCTVLKHTALVDKYFAIRAKENARYYAAKMVVLSEEADLQKLKEKRVHFVTKEFAVTKSRVEEAVELFDETAELLVLPDGCRYVPEGAVLGASLLEHYGTKLYVNGDFTCNEESTPFLEKLEYLKVKGCVKLLKAQEESFQKLNAEYEDIRVIKGLMLENRISVTVDAALLQSMPDGLGLENCVNVSVEADVTPEQILEFLQMKNCVNVTCEKKQKSALEAIGNIVFLKVRGEEGQENGCSDKDGERQEESGQSFVNADTYIL